MKLINLFWIFALASNTLYAQDGTWKIDSGISTVTSRYENSVTLSDQQGTKLHLSGEYNNQWGVSAGYLSTRIGVKPIASQSAIIHQENWLLSGYRHAASDAVPGRWTFQLDAHQIHNDASQGDSDGVRVFAPQIAWASYDYPIKLSLSQAISHYKDSPTTYQTSQGVGFGFNHNRNWVQLNRVVIKNLDPDRSMNLTNTYARDAKLTQFLNSYNPWVPSAITLSVERGQKFHAVDMHAQSVYNLPMINQGGHSLTGTWTLSKTNAINLQASKTRYTESLPAQTSAYNFIMRTFSAQLTHAW